MVQIKSLISNHITQEEIDKIEKLDKRLIHVEKEIFSRKNYIDFFEKVLLVWIIMMLTYFLSSNDLQVNIRINGLVLSISVMVVMSIIIYYYKGKINKLYYIMRS